MSWYLHFRMFHYGTILAQLKLVNNHLLHWNCRRTNSVFHIEKIKYQRGKKINTQLATLAELYQLIQSPAVFYSIIVKYTHQHKKLESRDW